MRAASWTLNPDALIDDERYHRLVKSASDPRIRLAILIAGQMGWRIGEILHIRIEDIDLPRAQIRKLVLKKKGSQQDKKVLKPISKVVLPEMKKLIGKRTKGWLFPTDEGHSKCDVMHREKDKGRCSGGHLSRRIVQYRFAEACRKAKIPKVKGRGIHALRHTFAFRAAERLRDPFKIRDLLDHAGVDMANVYVQSSDQRRAMDILDK